MFQKNSLISSRDDPRTFIQKKYRLLIFNFLKQKKLIFNFSLTVTEKT